MVEQVTRADVVVVGMGASGAIAAAELAQAGLRVVGIDKGAHSGDGDFRLKHDELRYYVRHDLCPRMDTDPITWRANDRTEARLLPWNTGPLGMGPLFLPPALGVGGGMQHWNGWTWRFLEDDFRMRTALVERYGAAKLPVGTTIVDWPFDYWELETYYERAEYELGVSGQAGRLLDEGGDVETIDSGNPFESPRRNPYPMPPIRPVAADGRFVEAAKRLGYHPFPAPCGVASVPYRHLNPCVSCGFCRFHPCHVDAKASSRYLIPAALATGNLTIHSHSRVFKVERGDDGRAHSVAYFDPAGCERRVEAEFVVLAAYALENARLLLLSGINRNQMVGKHFMLHNYPWVLGVLEDADTNPFAGPSVAGSAVDDLNGSRLDLDDLDFSWGSSMSFFGGDIQPIVGVKAIPPDVPAWGQEYKDWLRRSYRRGFGMYAQYASLPHEANSVDLDPTVKDSWGLPALRITHDWTDDDLAGSIFFTDKLMAIAREMGAKQVWHTPYLPDWHISVHDVGTTRMGDNPRTSVVDRDGRSHEVPNLWVLGGGVFPAYGGYNPTLTIAALAYRTAGKIMAAGGVTPASRGMPVAATEASA